MYVPMFKLHVGYSLWLRSFEPKIDIGIDTLCLHLQVQEAVEAQRIAMSV